MGRVSKRKLDQEIHSRILEIFWDHLANLKTSAAIKEFLLSLLSPTELSMLSKRLAIAVLLSKKFNYEEIDETLKVSKSTITTVHRQLALGAQGYKKAAEQVLKKEKYGRFLLKIDELLIQISPKKMYGSAAWKQKSQTGKAITRRKRQLNSL